MNGGQGGRGGGSGGAGSGGAGSGGASSGGAGAGGRASATGGAGGGRPDAGTDATAPSDATTGTDVNPNTLPAITLHLAGDSTVMTYDAGSAQEGWGQELGQFFISKVTIDNQAIGGASVESFHSSSRWTNITSKTKAGDYVMADFGINDSGTTADRHVDPMPFQTLFSQMNDEITAKQATFIIVTPSALQYWSAGKETNARLEPYVTVLKALGTMKSVLVDDLNARSLEYLNMIGQTAAMQIYIDGDKAHFTKLGATQMAQFVAEELRRAGSPLAAYLK